MPEVDIPTKLKKDAIVEAILEVRFDGSVAPEIIYGRAADMAAWKEFEQKRLPTADIPAAIREAEATLRYQPLFELRERGGNRVLRIGGRVISFHVLAPYTGWAAFQPELNQLVDFAFENAGATAIRRLGLRYLNCLTLKDHGIAGLQDLDLAISVSGKNLIGALNLNFRSEHSDAMHCMARVASLDFVEGKMPAGSVAFVDVDIFTPPNITIDHPDNVKAWIAEAHDLEKINFFQLWKPEILKKNREA